MGIARHFTSSAGYKPDFFNTFGDRMESPASNNTYSAFTFSAWIKQDNPNPTQRAGLCGRLFSHDNGWCVFVGSDQRLYFMASTGDPNIFASVPCPDISNWTFVAVTFLRYDFAGNDNIKFYAGNTVATFALIGTGTNTGIGFGELAAGRPIMIGNVYQGTLLDGGAVVNWNGSISKFGLRTATLTLEELKLEMACGYHVNKGIYYLVDMVGADPEPSISGGIAVPGSFLIFGTTIVSGAFVGCDFVPAPDQEPPTFPPPPVYPPITGACELVVEDPYDELTISIVCVDVLLNTSEIVIPPGTGDGGSIFPPDMFPPGLFPPGMFP